MFIAGPSGVISCLTGVQRRQLSQKNPGMLTSMSGWSQQALRP
jgi:hypothetical protein